MTQGSTPKAARQAARRETLRLVVSLERNEDPRLYDDLVAMRKGVKRAARLRLLAHDGLMLQSGIGMPAPGGHNGERRPEALGAEAKLTNQLFEPAADA